MKTEQEQIKAIKQIIDERVETNLGQVQGRHDNVIKTVDTIIIAQDIIDAGYGDVTEYKAEIERLKILNGNLDAAQQMLLKTNDRLFNQIEETVKQAQIDVLNKVKDKLEDCTGCYMPNCFETPTDDFAYDAKEVRKIIDELIEELQEK